MTESTSTTISYSPHTCVDTNVSPTILTSTIENTSIHSNFDFSAQEGDDDTSVPRNYDHDVRSHRVLQRDFRRLDIDSDTYTREQKNKKLCCTESASLSTTPTEQLTSTSFSKCNPSVPLSPENNNNNNHNDDDDSDKQDFRLRPSADFLTFAFKQMKDQSIFDCERSSSSSSSSPSQSKVTNLYGVDWSDQARSTSHCWFPYNPPDSSSFRVCSFLSCQNPKPTHVSPSLQCEACLIVVHTDHFSNLQTTATFSIPSCRPSFYNNNENDEQDQYDQHFWSYVPTLPKHCAFCKRKSSPVSLASNTRSPITLTSNLMNKTMTNPRCSTSGNPQLSGFSGDLQCLWCFHACHRSCWEQVINKEENNKCDYGPFRNIVVRPQWIRHFAGSSPNFQAQYPANNKHDTIYTPLILFVNKRSGGQSGEKIYRKLLHLLNPRQVFLLENDQTIIHALDIYSSLSNIRICVLGGDGTVGWVLGRLAELYPSLNNPPVCMCPLGTGNDLSRVLSWGEQYDPKRLLPTLTQIPQAQSIPLDRWQITINRADATNSHLSLNSGRIFLPFLAHPKFIRDTERPSYQNHCTLPNTFFMNYMSFGLDAAIALEFHDKRSRNPAKFSSPLKNKLMYLIEGRKYLNDFACSKLWSLNSYLRLICDGDDLTDSIKNCHTLLVLNIPGYASGTNPWGKMSSNSSSSSSLTTTNIQKDSDSLEQVSTSFVEVSHLPANTHEVYEVVTLSDCSNDQTSPSSITTTKSSSTRFERQNFGDKKVEVVGLSTTSMATIHIGFRGMRIAQCSQLRVEMCCPMTAQMDGEPFYLPEAATVDITHAGQVLVLKNESK